MKEELNLSTMERNKAVSVILLALLCCGCSSFRPADILPTEKYTDVITTQQEQPSEADAVSAGKPGAPEPSSAGESQSVASEMVPPASENQETKEEPDTSDDTDATASGEETTTLDPAWDLPVYSEDDYLICFCMEFRRWVKEGAEYRDGVYYQEYSEGFVPTVRIPVYAQRDLNSEKQYLSITDMCHVSATDTKNWIYISADSGTEGWMHIKRPLEYTDDEYAPGFKPEYYMENITVLTDEGLVPLYAAFIYDHDGEDSIRTSRAVDITDNTVLSSLTGDGNVYTRAFKKVQDLENFLNEYGAGEAVMEQYSSLIRQYDALNEYYFELEKDFHGNTLLGDLQIYIMKVDGEFFAARYLMDGINDRLVILAYTKPADHATYNIVLSFNRLSPEDRERLNNGEKTENSFVRDVFLAQE